MPRRYRLLCGRVAVGSKIGGGVCGFGAWFWFCPGTPFSLHAGPAISTGRATHPLEIRKSDSIDYNSKTARINMSKIACFQKQAAHSVAHTQRRAGRKQQATSLSFRSKTTPLRLSLSDQLGPRVKERGTVRFYIYSHHFIDHLGNLLDEVVVKGKAPYRPSCSLYPWSMPFHSVASWNRRSRK
jgi:hypothetical protein